MTNQPESQNQKLQELLLKLGHSYLSRNRYQDAFDKLTQLLALEPANAQALLLVTQAGIALENTSGDALGFYLKALDAKPDVKICRNLRDLLAKQNPESPVAVEISEKLENIEIPDQDTPEEPEPDETGQSFVADPRDEFAGQIEKLCWDLKFEEAIKLIRENEAFEENFLQKQLALTHAYQKLSHKQGSLESEVVETIIGQLELIKPDSLDALRDIQTLSSALPDEDTGSNGCEDAREFEFILGKIPMEEFFHNLQKKQEKHMQQNNLLDDIIFNDLQKADEWRSENEAINYKWSGFLATSLRTRSEKAPPEKIVKLVASYLYKIPQSVLRFTGNGFLCFAEDPLKQVSALLNLYKSIDQYNRAANEQNQIMLLSSMVAKQKETITLLGTDLFAAMLLKVLHLHKLTGVDDLKSHSLYIECPKKLIDELVQTDTAIQYTAIKEIFPLPGVKSEGYQIEKQQEASEIESPPEIQDLKILEKLDARFPFTTYLAKNRQLERPVILKTISFADNAKGVVPKETVLANIKKIGRLSHPNIATLFDLGENDDRVYYTREYVEGGDILNLNKSEEEWEINFLSKLEKIIRGLQAAAKHDIFHLNLKPSNIRINEANTLKLTDFSIFQNESRGFAAETETENYLAPEIIKTGKGDSGSDIYSLGLIACKALTGSRPAADSKDKGALKLDLPDRWSDAFRGGLETIITKATMKKPQDRFQNLAEFETELKKLYPELTTASQDV